MKEEKSFLECMFNDLDDISDDSDEEVYAELVSLGIDVDKTKERFLNLLSELKNNTKKG